MIQSFSRAIVFGSEILFISVLETERPGAGKTDSGMGH